MKRANHDIALINNQHTSTKRNNNENNTNNNSNNNNNKNNKNTADPKQRRYSIIIGSMS